MKRDLAHFCCSFITVSVRFCYAIVAFLVFQLFHPLDERQRVPGQIVPGPPGCHRLQREGAVPERKRVERHRVVQVFQQLAAQEADAVPVGGQRRGRPDVAAFQNFGRMQAAAPQLLQNILALPLGLVLQQQGLPLQPLPGKAALPGGSLLQRVSLAEHGVHPVPAQHPVAQAEKLGVQILLNTKATEILTNDGAACGIKAESTEHNYTINAKSVIIAAGGFGANFEETMNTWNASVAAGEDAEFGRSNGMDGDLSTAPYYAIKIAPGIHHTMGGLKINTDAQVLDTDGSIIPGLYAAGETTGGVHGGNRIGGNAVCDFVVFGRIAGSNASAYAAA